jgi:hypothetical protein
MDVYRPTYDADPGVAGFASVFVLLGLVLAYMSRFRRTIAALQPTQSAPLISRREFELAAAKGQRLLIIPCCDDVYYSLLQWQEIEGIKLSKETNGTHRLWISDDLKLAKWTELRAQLEQDNWPSFPRTAEP